MKKILAFFLCTMLMLALAAPAGAQARWAIWEDALCFAGLPQEDVDVTVNGAAVEVTQTTMEQLHIPILYFCIVDPSSSFSNIQREQQSQVLSAISEHMRPDDGMILARMNSDQLTVGHIMLTKEERQKAIDEKWLPSRATRLFEDVITGTEAAASDAFNTYLPCIVLISDGLTQGGESLEAAKAAVEKAGIAFHSIAVLCQFPDYYAKSNAQNVLQLGNGICSTPMVDGSDPAAIGEQIVQSMMDCAGIQLDTTGMNRRLLNQAIRLSGDDTIYLIPTNLLPTLPEPETEPETEPIVEPEPETIVVMETETPATELPIIEVPIVAAPQSGAPIGLIAGSIVMVLVVAGVVIFFFLQHKWEQKKIYEMLAADHKPGKIPNKKDTKQEIPEEAPQTADVPAPFPIDIGETVNQEDFDYLSWAATIWNKDEDGSGLMRLNFHADEQPQEEFDLAAITQLVSESGKQRDAASQIPVPAQSPIEASAAAQPVNPDEVSQPDAAPVAIPVFEAPAEMPVPAPMPVPGCQLKLTPTVDRDWTTEYFLPVNEPKTFGRSHDADFILNETDYGLSSIHFEMLWDGRALFLRDKNSTNGTALNNTPLIPDKWVRIKKNPVILAGAYEYKVSIAK